VSVDMEVTAQRTARVASAALRRGQPSRASRIPVSTAACLFTPLPSHTTSRPRILDSRRHLSTSPTLSAVGSNTLLGNLTSSSTPSSYFQRPSLPANTIIRFVPQQTAWIVERMGRFNRILEPGIAFLIPVLDRIAYVKSLKEAAIEIPSQSAITADNVALELDGVLYTRVFDAYKAR
jgi:hypothetical protein